MRRAVQVALRNLRREKRYAALNIVGLALGIACCLMLGLYLWSELTYDRHNVGHERIYRIANSMRIGDAASRDLAFTSGVLGPMLAEEYPDVILDYVRFYRGGTDQKTLLRGEERSRYWDNIFLTDDSVFDVFTHEIVYGDPDTALDAPANLAISRTVSEFYFGDENPVGRTLLNAAGAPVTVTLVFEDLPENTHLRHDAMVAYKGIWATPEDLTRRIPMLTNLNQYTYVLLPEGYDPRDYDALSEAFFEKYLGEMARNVNAEWRSWLEPLADIHLYSNLERDMPTGNPLYLYAFGAVGLFILGVACINYVNLATARAARRARAIGMRKILGAERRSLIGQLLGEAVLFALLATVLGVIVVEVLISLPAVNAVVGKRLELDLVGQPVLAVMIVGFGLLVGLVAGLYPAVYLSSFVPLAALVGRYQQAKGGLRLREALVFLQFTISVGVIACTLLMAAQMRYIADKALGFDDENRIIVPVRHADVIEREELIATELAKHPGVLGVSTSDAMMGDNPGRPVTRVESNGGAMTEFGFSALSVGENFTSVMGMKLMAGRDFSRRLLTDVGTSFLVNETFVRTMGWDEPIGKRIGFGTSREGRVVGVVEDFHFRSLHERIEPFVLLRNSTDLSSVAPVMRPFQERLMVVSVAREGLSDTLRHIEQRFAEFDPVGPFEFEFLDQRLGQLYENERRMMRMIGIFAAVCIFVAALGLFGLSAFTTEQRTKEIGIRKVLGASAGEIVLMLASRVLVLIGAGAVVASLVSWLAMSEWLSGFAYRAPINPAYFLLAAAGAAAVALSTIALQSWRTAGADPAESLRYE